MASFPSDPKRNRAHVSHTIVLLGEMLKYFHRFIRGISFPPDVPRIISKCASVLGNTLRSCQFFWRSRSRVILSFNCILDLGR